MPLVRHMVYLKWSPVVKKKHLQQNKTRNLTPHAGFESHDSLESFPCIDRYLHLKKELRSLKQQD